MRVLSAITLVGISLAGVSAAGAADFPIAHRGAYSARTFESGRPHAMLWLNDDQPGVVVRTYWQAPWRHHHYFPSTGEQPDIGRDEDLSVHGALPTPAKTYRRTWSNASALALERRIHVLPLDDGPPPRKRKPQNPD